MALERARLIEAYVEKERMEEALKLAHDIQMSMLPKIFPPFPERHEFDIFAAIAPAKRKWEETYTIFSLSMTTIYALLSAMCPAREFPHPSLWL